MILEKFRIITEGSLRYLGNCIVNVEGQEDEMVADSDTVIRHLDHNLRLEKTSLERCLRICEAMKRGVKDNSFETYRTELNSQSNLRKSTNTFEWVNWGIKSTYVLSSRLGLLFGIGYGIEALLQ